MVTKISLTYIRSFHPFLVTRPRPQVVYDVKETEAPSVHEHRFVPIFCDFDFVCCLSKVFKEVLFDHIQVVTA